MPHTTGRHQPEARLEVWCGCDPSQGVRCHIGHQIWEAKKAAHLRAMQLLEEHITSGCSHHTWEPYRAAQLEEIELMRSWADHLEPEGVAA